MSAGCPLWIVRSFVEVKWNSSLVIGVRRWSLSFSGIFSCNFFFFPDFPEDELPVKNEFAKSARRGFERVRQQVQAPLHPSWEASRRRKEQQSRIAVFQGKKITFDDWLIAAFSVKIFYFVYLNKSLWKLKNILLFFPFMCEFGECLYNLLQISKFVL